MEEAHENGSKVPLYMELAHLKHALRLPEYRNNVEMKNKLLQGIVENDMAPYYKNVCEELEWMPDNSLLNKMIANNKEKLEEYKVDVCEETTPDDDDEPKVWQKQLEYLSKIGDVEGTQDLAQNILENKTLPTYCRLDVIFTLFRMAYLNGCDLTAMRSAIEKAIELLDDKNCGAGGDWSARNKLKVYEAIWYLAVREYPRAANLLVDVVPTFESYELVSFDTMIKYTVLACMIALPRCDIKQKFSHGEMAQALSQHPDLREYYNSLYEGRYADFFICLANVERDMKLDPLLHRHYRNYVREMKLKAYAQLLQAYRSVSLQHMARAFGVTPDYIEKEVAHFAAAGRLQCKIDRVAGAVVSSSYINNERKKGLKQVMYASASDVSCDRDFLYQNTIKSGDSLLNRLKKLTRIMDF
ncbi:26S proteasome non-ATPase regulatory subunit 6 [Anabrus simplex]|uniref:26S proteasome non-ATPase regulatory subunit 6 n=1 Tax=Anabrus simplex TaxID=316456 RepID=UPI0035A3B48A